jgi:surfeit locus 1 family protein
VWRPAVGFGPERHLGYAIQWFALAIALLVIFISLSFKHPPAADKVVAQP